MNDKANEPAFPCPVGHIECLHPTGMSLRAYLAGQAMVGFIASYTPESQHGSRAKLVAECVQVADALIAELNKENK